MTELTSKQIQAILPHRYPMLMIDRVLELVPGQKAVSVKNITSNEAVVASMPDQSFPQMLMIEALAQTGAVALLSLPEFKGKTAYFGGVKSATFTKLAFPGDSLILKVALDQLKGPIGTGHGQITVNDELICQAQLTFMIG